MSPERVSDSIHRHFHAVACGAVLLAALLSLLRPVLLDDAYITFRAAANFAAGRGLVFNPGENVFSTTAPGYAVALAAFAALGADIVVAARGLCAAAIAAAGLSLVFLGRRFGYREGGLAAALALCFAPDLIATWGNEAALLLACACGGWALFEARRPAACGAAMAFGCMVRPDFALACLAFAGAFAARRDWRGLAAYAGVGVAAGACWIAFLVAQFGTPIPHTLRIKVDQGVLAATPGTWQAQIWCTFGEGLDALLRRTFLSTWFGALAACGAVAAMACPRLYPVAAWALLHAAAYAAMGVPGHFAWYFYPLWLCSAVFLGAGAQALARVLESAAKAGGSALLPQLLLGALAMHVAAHGAAAGSTDFARTKFAAYNEIAARLRAAAQPGDAVMLGEIGQIGFLTGLRVIDTHGIIHNFPRPGLLYDWPALVEEYEPRFIVFEGWWIDNDYRRSARAGALGRDFPRKGGGTAHYDQVDTFEVGDSMQPAILRRRG